MATSFLAAGKIDETFTPEQVVIGHTDVITKPQTIGGAAAHTALTVLGRITATGKLIPCNSAAVDGSQTPVAILVDAVDATSADVVAPVYVAGEFNFDALTWHASFNTEALKLAAFGDKSPIVLKKLAYSAV